MIAKGAQFDALAWLRAALIAYAPPGHMQAVARIEAWLWREMTEIYPRPAQPMSLTVFSEAANLRRGPVPEESVPPAWLAGQIWWHECWNQDVQNARNSREPLADVLYEIEPSISWAQERVAREIASRGIVVELNPSSELAYFPGADTARNSIRSHPAAFRLIHPCLHKYRQRRSLWHANRE